MCNVWYIGWLIAHEDRDVSCGYMPVLCHPLWIFGEAEQVNAFGEEKDIKVGEMEDHQSSGHCPLL